MHEILYCALTALVKNINQSVLLRDGLLGNERVEEEQMARSKGGSTARK